MKTTSKPRFRFAPSPNGPLHLGHAYSVLRNLEIAEKIHGDVLLRIDDIDQTRARKTHENAIIEDCKWLGMGVREPFRRQSQHLNQYKNALIKLTNMGLTYKAYASRKDIREYVGSQKTAWPYDPDGAPHFPKVEAFLKPSTIHPKPTSIRLDLQKALTYLGDSAPKYFTTFDPNSDKGSQHKVRPELWGDIALHTKDMAASYHLAVVVDDDAQGITHCVRGQDLEASTHIHAILQEILGLNKPRYHHHKLVTDKNKRKLSKSEGDSNLRQFIANGMTRGEILAMCRERL